jgi:hypothetical protein
LAEVVMVAKAMLAQSRLSNLLQQPPTQHHWAQWMTIFHFDTL